MIKNRLDEILEKKGKTRYWLARKTGISEGNLRRMAKNETVRIDYKCLDRICSSLDCKPGDLLEIEEEKEN